MEQNDRLIDFAAGTDEGSPMIGGVLNIGRNPAHICQCTGDCDSDNTCGSGDWSCDNDCYCECQND